MQRPVGPPHADPGEGDGQPRAGRCRTEQPRRHVGVGVEVRHPHEPRRLVVRPGLTGFAQLRMRRDMSWAEKLAHDLEYLADRSVGLYVRLLFATAGRLVKRLVVEVPAALRGRTKA